MHVSPLVYSSEHGDYGVPGEDAPSDAFVDQQLIVDYTGALARRAASHIRAGLVGRVDDRHIHPTSVACLRCAVLGATDHTALGVTLLEVLARSTADEEWNNSAKCTDTKQISRLMRLAISAATMEAIYGPRWGAVMLTCLRIERADFELLDYLTRTFHASRILGVHTRDSLAAYHLATTSVTRTLRDGQPVAAARRGAAAVRMGVAVAGIAVDDHPTFLDHLPVPAL